MKVFVVLPAVIFATMPIKPILIASVMLGSSSLWAETWVPIDKPGQLKKLFSGVSVEYTTEDGGRATATYDENGKGALTIGNTVFPREWKVVSDDKACYASDISRDSGCATFEQNIDDPTQYRSIDAKTGDINVFRVVDDKTIALSTAIATEAGSMAAPSASEIAAELSNPNSTMGTMNTFFDYTTFDGDLPDAGDASSQRITFQPSLPYPLSKTANLFVRPLIPIIVKQDVPSADGLDTLDWELGDISYDVSVFNSTAGGFVYGGGVAGSIPTATDDAAGLDQWLLGPAALMAVQKKWGVLGLLLNHQWDVAGEDDFDTSITGGQYFYSLFMKDGWVFGANPVFTYNHEASSGNELRFPIGIGVSKLALLGGRPVRFGLQYWYYVESPDDFGPQHLLRLQISPVVKLPW